MLYVLKILTHALTYAHDTLHITSALCMCNINSYVSVWICMYLQLPWVLSCAYMFIYLLTFRLST
jgi:hypothetical protein